MTRSEASDLLGRWILARRQATDFIKVYQEVFHLPAVADAAVNALKDAAIAAGKEADELQARIMAVMCGEPEATK